MLQHSVRIWDGGQFKPLLTETMIESLKPIQDKYQAVIDDKGYLESVLRQGREKDWGDRSLNPIKGQNCTWLLSAPVE
jgi:Tryptophanyl-tRNA synthetase